MNNKGNTDDSLEPESAPDSLADNSERAPVEENAAESNLSPASVEADNTIESKDISPTGAVSDASDGTVPDSSIVDSVPTSISTSKRTRKPKRSKFLLPGLVAASLLVLGGGYVALNSTVVPTAPSLQDKASESKICEEFANAFDSCSVTLAPHESIARDSLVSQSVDPGFKVNPAKNIELVYSSGPESVKFPNLIRKSYDDAVKELYSSGLEIGKVTVSDKADLEPNRIISASVAVGEVVKNGAAIDLEISSETVVIPDFAGKTKEQTELDLKNIEVSTTFIEKISDKPQGTVIGQSPAAGKVSKGSKVEITIAKPDEIKNIKVPSVVGMKEVEAQGAIAAAGFKNIAVVKIEGYKVTEALVTHVVPGEGRTIRSDSNVVIVISTPGS